MEHLDDITALLEGTAMLAVADHTVHRRGEAQNIGVDEDHGDALGNDLFYQRRHGLLVMGMQNNGIHLAREHVLEHPHLARNVGATLRSKHKGPSAKPRSLALHTLLDGNIVVELGGRWHVGDERAMTFVEGYLLARGLRAWLQVDRI